MDLAYTLMIYEIFVHGAIRWTECLLPGVGRHFISVFFSFFLSGRRGCLFLFFGGRTFKSFISGLFVHLVHGVFCLRVVYY